MAAAGCPAAAVVATATVAAMKNTEGIANHHIYYVYVIHRSESYIYVNSDSAETFLPFPSFLSFPAPSHCACEYPLCPASSSKDLRTRLLFLFI